MTQGSTQGPGDRNILVLEEDKSIAKLLVEILEGLNCRVVGPADRLPQALALLVDDHIDAAILDVKIEGEPSYAVAEEMIRLGIPWAFASANDSSEILRRYPDVPIVVKPYSATHIQQVLERLLTSERS
jgi:CheY-like chemotaxis protein